MSVVEILILSVGLSMDAFAVALCKGLAMDRSTLKKCSIVGAWFGVFQALMPFLGYLLGSLFMKYIEAFDHWVAFVLLALIGANMIKESFEEEEGGTGCSLSFKVMFVMAIATSIDALAAGITLVSLSFKFVIFAVLIIGVTTFLMSALGVKIGNVFGMKYKSKAEFAGGAILILLGVKMLLEGLGVINF
ncbi:MAG: manganese efflux pump [Ruminococcaceae bacterium]|nr:manganese efflux pump [Oscillospiraceae bacterium]